MLDSKFNPKFVIGTDFADFERGTSQLKRAAYVLDTILA